MTQIFIIVGRKERRKGNNLLWLKAMRNNDHRISIRLNRTEWLQLNLRKEESGLSVSEYIRHVLFSSPAVASRLSFEKRILWLVARSYLGHRESWKAEFDSELLEKLNAETDDLLKKWGY